MGTFENLAGKKFGRILVVEQSGKDKFNKIRWRCICDCGNETHVITSYLKNGSTKSCGCLHKEGMSKLFRTHGLRNTPEFEIWSSMIQRCTNEKNKRYHDYGGRGIKVCEKWLSSFSDFYKDMGPKPSNKYSIERIDNDRDYSPDNCKWATNEEQGRNKRPRKTSISGVTGVLWNKRDETWYATITVNKKYKHLGCFKNIDDAIKARKEAEQIYWNKKPS